MNYHPEQMSHRCAPGVPRRVSSRFLLGSVPWPILAAHLESIVFGRTEYLTSVICNGQKKDIGKILKIKINTSNRSSLFGEIVNNSDKKVA